ncbi:PLP-dependent cysteine synthase family protein [Sulfobacillus harzensis]|uniref:Cysteine synthase family protein n=1 Tax=Sulfobacillus harzensis TaxID=2729629 RepID=A0A7Y0Q2W2_9FIRM|nr:cysteine synthase family protein [Sulfobacillus harzensis]NMP22306.1 cysteine synthase family protein [Sulfobacillus harzensis]
MRILDTVLDAVGNTPLIRLHRVGGEERVRVVVKLEAVNPGGSIKDRIGLALIRAAEQSGRLKPGGTVVEATAGNTGVGLALACAVLGYRSLFVVPDKMSPDKIRLLKAYGAQVEVVPDLPKSDPNNYQNVAQRLVKEMPGAAYMGQFEQSANPETHYHTTAQEIWDGLDGQVAAVVAGAGTGGTISGIGRFMKERNAAIEIIGADPVGSIFTGPVAPFLIEGMGEDYYPETLDSEVVDRWSAVSDEEAFAMARQLARQEGLLVGGSSGAIVAVALREAPKVRAPGYIVAILPDTGRNYLSNIFRESD